MIESGWSARRVVRQLGHSDCVVRTSGSDLCHLHENQVQNTLDRPVNETATSLRLEWCHARGNWTAAEWNQVVFSNESRFNLSNDDNRVRVWRPSGERLNPAFVYSDTPLPLLV
ncbi:transposable element Tcb1 transposase [Trichonephila clavipes]|nr:transposable element Tcb1 transposase [Trichonephila clavipes]